MTDIVERLRQYPNDDEWHLWVTDAADEIKRLRAALHTTRNRPNIADAYHDAIDEAERLRGLLIKQANVIEKIQAERDALKAALRGMLDQFGFHRVHTGMVHDERQAILNAIDAIDAARRE